MRVSFKRSVGGHGNKKAKAAHMSEKQLEAIFKQCLLLDESHPMSCEQCGVRKTLVNRADSCPKSAGGLVEIPCKGKTLPFLHECLSCKERTFLQRVRESIFPGDLVYLKEGCSGQIDAVLLDDIPEHGDFHGFDFEGRRRTVKPAQVAEECKVEKCPAPLAALFHSNRKDGGAIDGLCDLVSKGNHYAAYMLVRGRWDDIDQWDTGQQLENEELLILAAKHGHETAMFMLVSYLERRRMVIANECGFEGAYCQKERDMVYWCERLLAKVSMPQKKLDSKQYLVTLGEAVLRPKSFRKKAIQEVKLILALALGRGIAIRQDRPRQKKLLIDVSKCGDHRAYALLNLFCSDSNGDDNISECENEDAEVGNSEPEHDQSEAENKNGDDDKEKKEKGEEVKDEEEEEEKEGEAEEHCEHHKFENNSMLDYKVKAKSVYGTPSQAFSTIVKSEDGHITLEGFQKHCAAFFRPIKGEEAKQLFMAMDSRGNGRISSEEYIVAVGDPDSFNTDGLDEMKQRVVEIVEQLPLAEVTAVWRQLRLEIGMEELWGKTQPHSSSFWRSAMDSIVNLGEDKSRERERVEQIRIQMRAERFRESSRAILVRLRKAVDNAKERRGIAGELDAAIASVERAVEACTVGDMHAELCEALRDARELSHQLTAASHHGAVQTRKTARDLSCQLVRERRPELEEDVVSSGKPSVFVSPAISKHDKRERQKRRRARAVERKRAQADRKQQEADNDERERLWRRCPKVLQALETAEPDLNLEVIQAPAGSTDAAENGETIEVQVHALPLQVSQEMHEACHKRSDNLRQRRKHMSLQEFWLHQDVRITEEVSLLQEGEVGQLDPLEIRFTHGSIFHRFRNGDLIDDTIAASLQGTFDAARAFPPLEIVHYEQEGAGDARYFSLSNRRLFVFRVLRVCGILRTAPVILYPFRSERVQRLGWDRSTGRWATKWERSFSTSNYGLWIRARSRFVELQLPSVVVRGMGFARRAAMRAASSEAARVVWSRRRQERSASPRTGRAASISTMDYEDWPCLVSSPRNSKPQRGVADCTMLPLGQRMRLVDFLRVAPDSSRIAWAKD